MKNCLLFFNLESLFHPKDNDIQFGGFTFRANTDNLQVLQQLRKPDTIPFPLLLSLANNHTVNGGYEGITTTQQLLDDHHIGYIGAGTDSEQARTIFSFSANGIQLCFQAYSYDGKNSQKV